MAKESEVQEGDDKKKNERTCTVSSFFKGFMMTRIFKDRVL